MLWIKRDSRREGEKHQSDMEGVEEISLLDPSLKDYALLTWSRSH